MEGRTPHRAASGSPLLDRARAVLAGERRVPGRPCVTLAWAQSLDGCLAAAPGTSTPISNAATQRVTHRLRALHDSILVGINTVLVDDPRLTVRGVEGADPTPVVLDSRLRTPPEARLLQGPGTTPVLLASEDADPAREAALVAAGARVVRLPGGGSGGLDLVSALEHLGRLGFRSLMVEGGSRVLTSFLAAGLADQVLLTVSPMLLGGLRAVGPLGSAEVVLHDAAWEVCDGDLLVHATLS